ncbi:MAG: coproporphyrinogen-III oxidase family protein [Bryobacterales bacterium]|nr:coproporphyrinogen-III oxidase family protein [Bryobacterales bacterium]
MASPGIYISIPFCAQKCTYCNFRSDVYARALRTDYVRCLARELCSGDTRRGDTLYFGGGSPSLLEPEEFEALSAVLPHRRWAEATIEVAPGEAAPERISSWVETGINRVSLGVQSFDPAVARAAGRKHDPETVQTEIRCLRERGILNISVDLIAGLARQTALTWRRSLDWIERLGVGHVSVYMLETDDASRLGRELQAGGSRYGARSVPCESEIVDFYLEAVEQLRSLGLERYEVSNFARPGRRSAHNLKYWRMEPYLGFGSDAHSFSGRRRWSNVATAPEYVRRMASGSSPRDRVEEPGPKRMLEDRVLTGLRTSDGIRLGNDEWRELRPRARRLADRGWLIAERPSIRLTDRGILFADEAIAELLG